MASDYVLNLLVAAAKVAIWFWVIFVLLPRWLFPAPRREHGGAWAGVVRMGFYTIIVVHVLVLVGVYDLFSLILGYVALYLFYLLLQPAGLPRAAVEDLFTRSVVFGLDALEGRVQYREWARRRWDEFRGRMERQLPTLDQVPWGVALLWVLLTSIYLRLYEALHHAAFSPTFYTHLRWLKSLTRRELYVDGISPYGAFALLSGLKLVAFLDESLLLQVAQGLAGGLTAAAVYFAIRHFSGRRSAALLGASLYGIFSFGQILPGLPLYPNEALPLELALAFLLPSWVFLARYLTEQKSAWLGLAFQGTATAFLIHPFVGAAALAGWALALLAGLACGRWRGRGALRVALAAGGVLVVGNIFYLVGLLGGKAWDVDIPALTLRTGDLWLRQADCLARLASQAPVLLAALFAAPLLFLPGGDDASAGRRGARAGRVTLGLAFLVAVAVLLASGQSRWGGWLAGRPAATLVSLLACAVLGAAYGALVSWVAALGKRLEPLIPALRSPIWGLGAAIVILAVLLVASPRLVVKGACKAEYDVTALQIRRIKQDHLAYTWTIVGPGEVLPHILGQGWYLNGDYFLQNYAPETYHYDPDEPELSIPTEHVFIVVEKKVYAASHTADALRQRVAMERGMWDWCRAYERSHDNMSIYYEDENIVIYHIHHPLRVKEDYP